MKISEQLQRDFLTDIPESTKTTRTYDMSYGYLIGLILEIQALENDLELYKGLVALDEKTVYVWKEKAAKYDELMKTNYELQSSLNDHEQLLKKLEEKATKYALGE